MLGVDNGDVGWVDDVSVMVLGRDIPNDWVVIEDCCEGAAPSDKRAQLWVVGWKASQMTLTSLTCGQAWVACQTKYVAKVLPSDKCVVKVGQSPTAL